MKIPSHKYWSMKYQRWITEYDFKYFKVNVLTLFQKRKKIKLSFNKLDDSKIPSLFPVIYSLVEFKQKYTSYMQTPISPEIMVRHNGKYYTVKETFEKLI